MAVEVEDWIDKICDVWGTVSNGKGGFVRSFYVYKRDEFPETITAAMMPCVLTYTLNVGNDVNAADSFDHWQGRSEFHLFPNVDKRNFPAIMLYFKRIRQAAAANIKLGLGASGLHYFLLKSPFTRVSGVGITGPVVMQYGSEDPHHGLIVDWLVKADVTENTPVSEGT